MRKPKSWNATSRHYFAYGLALDRATASAWRGPKGLRFPELGKPERASLADHALFFTGRDPLFAGRVAVLQPARGEQVHGCLFELDPAQWAAVEAFERDHGAQPRAVKLETERGEVEATAFVAAPSDAPWVDEAFLAALLRGLTEARLPADYLRARTAEALLVERVQQVGRERRLLPDEVRP